ncbi:MAG: class I SAM-dependent methyltransferase [Cognaticolwellia sp.]
MQHWNSYWSRTKSLNSFAEGEHSQGYVGPIADFWQTVFSTLPTSAKILDLATGNGGLAVLAQQYKADFDVSASDAASINPLAIYSSSDPIYQQLNTIQFFGNMPSENLTFNDKQFDCVISQFGFEYAKSEAALRQLNRVLKDDGEFIALVHHQDSFISVDCQIGLKVLDSLSQVGGLLTQLQDFGDFCQTIADKNQPSSEQQIKFKEKNANLLQLFKQQQHACNSEQELDWYNLIVKELLPAIIDWQNTDGKRVLNIIENLYSFQHRLQDQHTASWALSDVERIKSLLDSWTLCDIDIIEIDEGILCWVIKAKK